MFRALCAHHQEVKIVLYSIWYHHTSRWPSGAQVESGPLSTCVRDGHLHMKMEPTECSETSAYKIQTPENCPEESIHHSEHGESLKSRILRHTVRRIFSSPNERLKLGQNLIYSELHKTHSCLAAIREDLPKRFLSGSVTRYGK